MRTGGGDFDFDLRVGGLLGGCLGEGEGVVDLAGFAFVVLDGECCWHFCGWGRERGSVNGMGGSVD